MHAAYFCRRTSGVNLLYLYVITSLAFLLTCQAKRGGFKDTHADDLLVAVLKATLQQTGVEPQVRNIAGCVATPVKACLFATQQMTDNCVRQMQAIGDIVVGSVLGPSSQRANEARIAMFLAGFPETVPVRTVNRCGTGHAFCQILVVLACNVAACSMSLEACPLPNLGGAALPAGNCCSSPALTMGGHAAAHCAHAVVKINRTAKDF